MNSLQPAATFFRQCYAYATHGSHNKFDKPWVGIVGGCAFAFIYWAFGYDILSFLHSDKSPAPEYLVGAVVFPLVGLAIIYLVRFFYVAIRLCRELFEKKLGDQMWSVLLVIVGIVLTASMLVVGVFLFAQQTARKDELYHTSNKIDLIIRLQQLEAGYAFFLQREETVESMCAHRLDTIVSHSNSNLDSELKEQFLMHDLDKLREPLNDLQNNSNQILRQEVDVVQFSSFRFTDYVNDPNPEIPEACSSALCRHYYEPEWRRRKNLRTKMQEISSAYLDAINKIKDTILSTPIGEDVDGLIKSGHKKIENS